MKRIGRRRDAVTSSPENVKISDKIVNVLFSAILRRCQEFFNTVSTRLVCLVETVPLIEHPNEAPVALLETKQHCHGDRTWSLLLVYQNAEQRHVLSACRSTMF